MKTSKIVDAMGYIDDDLISASIDYKPRKIGMKWIPYAAAAACAACLCFFAVRFFNYDIVSNNAGSANNAGNAGNAGNVNSEVFSHGFGTGDVSGENGEFNAAGAASGIITGGASSYFGATGTTPVENPGDPASVSGDNAGSKPEDPTISYGEMPESGNPGDSTTSSGENPNAYLSTKPVTFSTAKEQVRFVEVKEVSGADFVGYELDYVMPSEMLIALRYVYSDGEVSVSDYIDDSGVIFSPEWYEKIERDGMVFWKPLMYDTPTVIYISKSDVTYFASFESDADLSKAIDTIKSLI